LQRRKIRTKRLELGAALVAALLLAGCGGGDDRPTPVRPKLPAALAAQLAERSDRVATALAAGDSCAAQAEATALQQQTVQAINARRVPTALQEDLSGSVNDLVARIQCVHPQPPDERDDDENRGKGHGKGKDGKGKHGEEGEG
jgi:hypothetical protein